MDIALIGYGKMGRIIHERASSHGHTIYTIDPHANDADAKEVTEEILDKCSCAIHFTSPDALKDSATRCIEAGCNLVVGTTGWYEDKEYYEKLVAKHNTGFLYSPNFSIGVNAFFQIVQEAAKIFNVLEEYDVAGVEYHHNQKQDSPSGTAHALSTIVTSCIERKKIPYHNQFNRAPEPEEFHFASVRCGNIEGTHTITFDSKADTISLQHAARSRVGFALGALQAAEWLDGRQGFYSMDSFMQHILGSTVKGV